MSKFKYNNIIRLDFVEAVLLSYLNILKCVIERCSLIYRLFYKYAKNKCDILVVFS